MQIAPGAQPAQLAQEISEQSSLECTEWDRAASEDSSQVPAKLETIPFSAEIATYTPKNVQERVCALMASAENEKPNVRHVFALHNAISQHRMCNNAQCRFGFAGIATHT